MRETYMKELYNFFEQLRKNNDRAWFAEHKGQYDELRGAWLADVDRLIAAIAQWWPEVGTQSGKSSAFRIYRDTRFSNDKTPYKTFFSAAISPWGRKDSHAGFYIQTGVPNFFQQGLYGGIWKVDAPTLRKLRHAIVDNIEEWETIVNAPEMLKYYPEWCSDMLKTIPKGWERNHPQAVYLRMTNYGKFYPADEKFFLDPAWPERSAELLRVLKPFVDFINYSIDE